MKECTTKEIVQLQDNLALIRKAGGWSTEEFGDMIGVTKQTISNLENKKTPLSKMQYIAIRAVLDYEMNERNDDAAFLSTINICLNSNNLPEEDIKKAKAFIEGANKTGLDKAAILGGLIALVGTVAATTIMTPLFTPIIANSTNWIAKLIKKNK